MSNSIPKKGMGWLRDLPDFRYYTLDNIVLQQKHKADAPVRKVMAQIEKAKRAPAKTSIDLRQWCSPIEDQENIGSCTAHAGVGLYEYYERRAFGNHINGSRLFLYKVTRNLLGWSGDTGAYLRTTMGAIALFGIAPEQYWPYDTTKYDIEASPFLYSFAKNFNALAYYRLDSADMRGSRLLNSIKDHLTKGLPMMFGFTCYSSLNYSEDGKIAFPDNTESIEGGHAVMAVGYDDKIEIVNPINKKKKTTGAILIRNSWGTSWGEEGYGWLPYEYILRDLADDWWAMTKASWIETGQFGI